MDHINMLRYFSRNLDVRITPVWAEELYILQKKKIFKISSAQIPPVALWWEVLTKPEVKVQKADTLFATYSSKSWMTPQEIDPRKDCPQSAGIEKRNISHLKYSRL